MKRILLSTTVLAAILLSGCANKFEMQDNSLVTDRYKKSVEVTNYDLDKVLNKMKYRENYKLEYFTNSAEELENVEKQRKNPRSFLPIKYVACEDIVKEGRISKDRSETELQDMYDFYSRKSRMNYCGDLQTKEETKIAQKFGLEKPEQLNINDKKQWRLIKEFRDKRDILCEQKENEDQLIGDLIQDKKGLYVDNIKNLDPQEYFDFKVFKDLETGFLSVQVTNKINNRSEILHEDKNICEFTNRSRPETIALNKEALKNQQARIKYERENPEKPVYTSCEDDYKSGRPINIACQDSIRMQINAAKNASEFDSNLKRMYK